MDDSGSSYRESLEASEQSALGGNHLGRSPGLSIAVQSGPVDLKKLLAAGEPRHDLSRFFWTPEDVQGGAERLHCGELGYAAVMLRVRGDQHGQPPVRPRTPGPALVPGERAPGRKPVPGAVDDENPPLTGHRLVGRR